jgi:septum formation protein
MLLASRSPRRRSLLEQAGIPHFADDPGVDDGLLRPGAVPPTHWVASLAYLKAAAGLARRPDHQGLVLGADTVCVAEGRILGQPRDEADAERMLRMFEGRSHDVLTGIALLVPGADGRTSRHLFTDAAVVRVSSLGPRRIGEYLATGRWRGKAGAYNLEDRLAAGWPIEFDGDPTTVVGLPMRRLIPRLRRLGVDVAPAGGKAA